nr:retrovirus-related Pol polyprotein from transposon TNT 1-94 [Tanacetum cinerariifolium]
MESYYYHSHNQYGSQQHSLVVHCHASRVLHDVHKKHPDSDRDHVPQTELISDISSVSSELCTIAGTWSIMIFHDHYIGQVKLALHGNKATIQDSKVVIQNVQGRQNRGQGNNARGAGAAGYRGAQNRVGFANPGQTRQIKCYNCNCIGHIARNCTQPKRPQNSEYLKDKTLLMQAQENGVKLDEEQLLFIAGRQDKVVDDDVDKQPIQDLALNVDNVFQANDCDAFDSDVDGSPTAQTMFMANLSSKDPVYDEVGPCYDSDVLSEVHDHDHYQDAFCEHHEVHEMHDNVQPNYVVDSHTGYASDSNMIPYDHYYKRETIHDYYVQFAKLINDMRNIKMTMSKMQLNSKFVNNMLPEWGRFVIAVKLNRGLRDSNYDLLYAYLKQHETHANENKMTLDRFSQHTVDPLALMSNVSQQQHYSQSSSTLPSTYVPPHLTDTTHYDSRGRQIRGQGTNPQGGGAAGFGEVQNRVGNANRGQARKNSDYYKDKMLLKQAQENGVALDEEQLLFLAGGQDIAIDEDVDDQLYEKDNAILVVHSNVSSVPNDAYMLIDNDMYEPHAQSVSTTSPNTV